MVTESPPRLGTAIVLILVVRMALAVPTPRLRPAPSEDARFYSEKKNPSGRDEQAVVLTVADASAREELVVVEISYSDDTKNEQGQGNDDLSRYYYNIKDDAPKPNSQKLIPVASENGEENPTAVKVTEEDQIPGEETEQYDAILQWSARKQTEIEDNMPGSHNWPKHLPAHLRPISPFPDGEHAISKEQSFLPEEQIKRDEAFVPSDSYPPPPRAGPYLYPESIVDPDFRVPIY